MSSLENPVYRFRGFELQPAERRLLADGQPLALTPKVFDTLVLLVERAGHVVSKDELMKLIWPRGYVDDSNLTKHVWLIRRALNDLSEDSRFIETVPKVGYRFVAPVTRMSAAASPPAPASAPAPDAPSPAAAAALVAPAPAAAPAAAATLAESAAPRTRRPRLATWLMCGAGITLVLIAALSLRLMGHPVPVVLRHGRTVAFVPFNNLSGNAKDAWLARALTEMLGAELDVAADLRVLPDELVRNASADLAPPAAGGYAPATLARLRQRLDADYVVSGSYLVGGAADDAPLRLDIALQDARDGSLRGALSQQAGVSTLLTLVSHSGATLRERLGMGQPSAAALDLLANAQPPNIDVARRLGFALEALQHYDAARARDELLEAIAEAPGYAPAYTYLAQAWSALGYRDKALAAAEQAAHYALNLPPEQRLQAQAVVLVQRAQWREAAQAWGDLTQLKPLNPDYRLAWIDAQVGAGDAVAAQRTLRELQRLPGMNRDPRIELAATRLAAAQSDPKGAAQHATAALQQAREHDAAGLVADAQVQLASAQLRLHQDEAARASLERAIEGYRAIHNPRGEAEARRRLAEALSELNHAQEAREEYQRALALDQSIGDSAGVAQVYRDLCSMLWVQGDRDGAQAAARHGLALAREVADVPLQAWMLQALANITSDEAASDEAVEDMREVIRLATRPGEHPAWALANLSDILRMRGELSTARSTCAQAEREAAQLTDPQFAIFSGFTCALIDNDLGNAEAARKGFEDVLRRVGSGGETTYASNSQLMLGQLDMDAGRFSAAREHLEEATRGFAAAEERTGEADAEALLALCEQALGDAGAREQAARRAGELRRAMTTRQEVFVVDIALGQLAAEDGAGDGAQRLLALAADAERRHWLGWALEARLAAWEALRRHGAAGARALRAQIEHTARAHGFGRILSNLERFEAQHPAARSQAARPVRPACPEA